MTGRSTVIDHPARRLLIALPQPYEASREQYETLVPNIDPARFHDLDSWQAVLGTVEASAPHGFMRYHTIAERMFRHDPSSMLHAPLRTLLYANPDGNTKLAVDQPSLLFASYDSPDIATVGEELDALLAGLIELLDGTVPPQLGKDYRP
jgi:hypothetical protein